MTEINNAISSLKINKSNGHDQIPPTFCELPLPSLLLFFTYLFNFLLQMVSFLKIVPFLKSFLYRKKVIVKALLRIGPFQS